MNEARPAQSATSPQRASLLQSGVIFAAISFLTGIGNLVCQIIISRIFKDRHGEFSLANDALAFSQFLGLPMAIGTNAVVHYLARFHFSRDSERLHGLLAGSRRFLFRLTIAGSILAAVLVKPLSAFFHFRAGVMLVALACVLGGLWNSYVTALCQGLSWFKRLALIGLLAVCLRLAFCSTVVWKYPIAEMAVLASVFMLLSNVVLLFWRKEFPGPTETVVSPWTREFAGFLAVSAACVGGNTFFLQGDMLVAQRYFSGVERDAYIAAGLLARALPQTVGPLLIVLFTHRSSQQHGHALREQLKLLGFYAAGLIGGAVCLLALRDFCLGLLHRATPEAARMLEPFAAGMVLIGLLQALGTWALASRWFKTAMLYGALGVVYWLVLLVFGKSPEAVLRLMPITAGAAFVLLFVFWLAIMRAGNDGRMDGAG